MNRKKIFKNFHFSRHLPALVIFTITVLICREFFKPGLPTGTDALIWIKWLTLSLRNNWWFTTWFPINSFGESTLFYNLFMNPFLFLISRIFNSVLTIKFYIFILIYLSGIFSYLFIKFYLHDNHSCIGGIIIFMSHQVFLSQIVEGHIYLVFGYAFFPLVFLLYTINVSQKNVSYVNILFFVSILSLYIICSQPYFIFMTFIYLLLYTLIIVAWEYYKNEKIKIKIIFKNVFYLSLFSIGSCLFYVVPYWFGVRQYLSPPGREFLLKLVDSVNLFESLLGKSSEISYLYFSHNLNYDSLYPLGFYLGLIIPVISYFAIILKRNKTTIIFTILAIVSTFLGKGMNPPLNNIYEWLYSYIPFFSKIWVADRWNIMQSLSYSLLSSITIFEISEQLRLKRHSKDDIYVINIVKTFLIIIIIVSNMLFSFNAYLYGSKTYEFPREYISPYYDLNQIEGDYYILPIPYMELYSRDSQGGMSRSPSFYSPTIHNKGVITGEGGTTDSRLFLDFVGNLINFKKTDGLLDLLGPLNVKYILIQPFPGEQRVRDPFSPMLYPKAEYDFFINQKGANQVYIDSAKNVLLENKNWSPLFHLTNDKMVVFGGLRTLLELSTLEGFNMSNWAFSMVEKKSLSKQMDNANYVCISNTDFFDLLMLLNKHVLIEASKYSSKSAKDPKNVWIKSQHYLQNGYFQFSNNTLSTQGNNKAEIYLTCEKEGDYYFFIRMFYAQDRGKLSISIGNYNILNGYRPEKDYKKRQFEWLKLGPIYLEKGIHTINIYNDGSGNNDIDVLSLIKTNEYDKMYDDMSDWWREVDKNVILLYETESLFDVNIFQNWKILDYPYKFSNSYALSYGEYEGFSKGWFNIKNLNFTALSPSWYMFNNTLFNSGEGGETLEFGNKNWENYIISNNIKVEKGEDIGIDFRWDGGYNYYRIQQIGSEKKPTIMLVKGTELGDIYLWSYELKDYNPKLWHNWDITVNGNNIILCLDDIMMLNYTCKENPYLYGKVRYRTFETKAQFKTDIVLEKWPNENILSEIYVPKEDEYALAIRGITYFGNMKIIIDDSNSFNLMPTFSQDIQWNVLGNINLTSGLHKIEVNSEGIFLLDQIALFSKDNDNNNVIPIQNMLQNNTIQQYKQINPTKYIVDVTISKPGHLLFAQSYHPLWKAYIKDLEINTEKMFGVINGFYLSDVGEYQVRVEFKGQYYLFLGCVFSLLTYGLILFQIIRTKKLNKYLLKIIDH